MFIIEILLLLAESLFLIYLIRKQKNISKMEKTVAEKEKTVMRQKRFLDSMKSIIDEDYKRELEERKDAILKEFSEKLYGYHMAGK